MPRFAFAGNRDQSLNHLNASKVCQQYNHREAMNINSLSQDILALIVPYLYTVTLFRNPHAGDCWKEGKVSPYATISRQWQYAIELWTFSNLNVLSSDLSAFKQVFGTVTRRQRLLRRLDYEIDLPPPTDRDYQLPEESRDNAVFQEGIVNLLRTLEMWDLDVLGLGFLASSPMDRSDGPRLSQGPEPWKEYAYLNIEEISLPQLPSVVSLDILNPIRVFHPAAMRHITSLLPNLERLGLHPIMPKLKQRQLQREHWLG